MEPQRTPYDLNFRLFGTHVRVHPLFWLLAAILGWQSPPRLESTAIWIACVFVSILVHEFGHIWMGRVFGSRGHIILWSFGGLAVPNKRSWRWWEDLLVSVAGPLAGFVLFGIVFGVSFAFYPLFALDALQRIVGLFQISVNFMSLVPPWAVQGPSAFPHFLVREVIVQLFWINLLWGFLNLLPIWPLDGGRISRAILTAVAPRRALRWSLGISFLVAGVISLHCLIKWMRPESSGILPFLAIGSGWMALMFGVLAIQSFQMLQQADRLSDPFFRDASHRREIDPYPLDDDDDDDRPQGGFFRRR
ncbi:MAG: site-2 protease family protein [Gemmataceae bacterium]